MEPTVNRVKGYINTLRKEIYGAGFEVPTIFCKKIGYDERDTIFEKTVDSDKELTQGWFVFENGSRWGGSDVHACFKLDFTVTEDMSGKDIWMQLKTGATDIWNTDNPQFLVYINNEIVCGMDMNHHEVRITKSGVPGENFTIGIYAYSNSATISDYFELSFMEKHSEVEKLYYDVKVPMDACLEMRPEDLNRIGMLSLLNEAVNRTELRVVPSKEFYASVKAVDEWLNANFYDVLSGESDVIVHSIGHTHIDVAWKWPVRQTREKVLRSFATVLHYMEDYPAYRFMSSQPQLYKFVKEASPELYERIKKRIAEGRWETEGAMWLEADCNLSSGEALVRQILKGKQFFENEFNTGDNKVLWLPDVFGYSAALPQILKKSGVDYFMTTKIGWNEFNKMPHDLMMWKGIDGSEVMTYFISTTDHKAHPDLLLNPSHETTYNGRQNVSQVMGTWQRFSDKDLTNEVLTCFGHGDGGGGATMEMLEEDMRIAKGLPGVPVTKQTFSKEFFDIISEKTEGKKLPKWNGELYLEYHRGTYTSQANNKKNNRRAEFKNEQAEWLSTWATLSKSEGDDSLKESLSLAAFTETLDSELLADSLADLGHKSFVYPKDKLDEVWETTLLNQFHDILPGSSIGEVYDVTDKEYEEIFKKDDEIISDAIAAIFGLESPAELTDTNTGSVALFNPVSFERDELVETEFGPVLVKGIPSKGYKTVDMDSLSRIAKEENGEFSGKKSKNSPFEVSEDYVFNSYTSSVNTIIETPFYKVKFNKAGEIISLYDKENFRELVKEGEAFNRLIAFEDRPWEYDCWNIDIYYKEKSWTVDNTEFFEITEDSSERLTVTIKRKFMNSSISQDICFYKSSGRIDFKTNIDWNEQQILLKAAFPVDVLTNKCTCDIQFGNVERPTHRNTSWDEARFEICSHKWVDVSEKGYGMAVLNDCKYGSDVLESTISLTLLKSGIFPDPDADKGHHEFTYAILPHRGDFAEGNVIREAYKLNQPVITAKVQKCELTEDSLYSVNVPNVMADTIKLAENSDGFIIRMHECHGKRTTFELDLRKFNAEAVIATDLREKAVETDFDFEAGILKATIKPYEILTYRIL